jgi:L,D-peptidoglycan transpeptidase YkuD (ErfK/YbiS/YcfS/YnhG family)
VLLVLLLTAGLLAATSQASYAAPADEPDTVRLDGVTVRLREGTTQVVTVNRTQGHHARVTWWRLTDDGWKNRMQAKDGRIGYGGLVPGHRREQGTGTTPSGTYLLPWAFGRHEKREDWDLPYRQIRTGDYWVQDNASDHYNRYRNKAAGGFRWRLPPSHPESSERLTDYRVQYEFSVVIGFNRQQVRHRGSGIFLHVNGSGATAGCVSAPRWFLLKVMRRIDRREVPLIAIGA